MRFYLDECEAYDRTIKGTVFYDHNIGSDGVVIGDGIYNDGDGTVEGAVVELRHSDLSDNSYSSYDTTNTEDKNLFTGDENQLATIYYTIDNNSVNKDDTTKKQTASGNLSNSETTKGVVAKTVTNSDGYFEFKGVVPGNYFILIKYPDGHEENLYAENDPDNPKNPDKNPDQENLETGSIKINGIQEFEGIDISTPNYLKSTIISGDLKEVGRENWGKYSSKTR